MRSYAHYIVEHKHAAANQSPDMIRQNALLEPFLGAPKKALIQLKKAYGTVDEAWSKVSFLDNTRSITSL